MSAFPSFQHLIPVPSEPIRQTWIKRYRMILRKLDKLKKEWRLFEQESIPKFQAWYHTTFAKEIARINEWNEKVREQEVILSAIIAHRRIYGFSELEAYSRVKDKLMRKSDPFPDAADIERYEKKQRQEQEAREAEEMRRREEREKRRREAEERFWASMEEKETFREAMENAFSGKTDHEHPSPEAAKASKREEDSKTIYRKIVRALHPDSGHEMTPPEKEWWLQAQTAYRHGDLETLKLILLKIEGSGNVPVEKIDQIGAIIDLCASLFEEQDQIEFQKKRLKKDPVYRFWASRGRTPQREKLQLELQAQLASQFRRMKQFVDEAKQALHELDYALRAEEDEDSYEYRYREGRGRGRGRGRDEPHRSRR